MISKYLQQDYIPFTSNVPSSEWAGSYAQAWCTSFYGNTGVWPEGSAESVEEADTYFTNDDDRKAYDTASSGSASRWWLRSPNADSSEVAGDVDRSGQILDRTVSNECGARPAFNFDLNSVLFSSAAAGGPSRAADKAQKAEKQVREQPLPDLLRLAACRGARGEL